MKNKKKWELVNWCEFDKFASKSYCAIHNETADKNLGDITKVNEKEIADFTWGGGGRPVLSLTPKYLRTKGMCQLKN